MAQPMDGAGAPTPPSRAERQAALPRRRAASFSAARRRLLLLEAGDRRRALGCHNRAYLVHRARDEIARRARYGQRLSLLLLEPRPATVGPDEDGAQGDRRRRPNLALRPTDTLARWQGSELVVLLPSTGLAGASRLARRLCTHVAATGVGHGPAARPSASASPPRSAGRRGWSC